MEIDSRRRGASTASQTGEVSFDFKRVIARSREAADKLSKGVRFLLRKNKVDYIEAQRDDRRTAYRGARPPCRASPRRPPKRSTPNAS